MEDFVPFEIARKLKEKGFREKCMKHYYPNSNDWFISSSPECDNYSSYLDVPTISQVLEWLREEKKIHICISYSDNINTMWEYEITLLDGVLYQNADDGYVSYEQAALAGIEYVLNNLI